MAAEDSYNEVAAGKPEENVSGHPVTNPVSVGSVSNQEQLGSLGKTLMDQVKASAAALNASNLQSNTPGENTVALKPASDHIKSESESPLKLNEEEAARKPDTGKITEHPADDDKDNRSREAVVRGKVDLSKPSDRVRKSSPEQPVDQMPDVPPKFDAKAASTSVARQQTFVPPQFDTSVPPTTSSRQQSFVPPQFDAPVPPASSIRQQTYAPPQFDASAASASPIRPQSYTPLQFDTSVPSTPSSRQQTYVPPQFDTSAAPGSPSRQQTYAPPQFDTSVPPTPSPRQQTFVPPQFDTSVPPTPSPRQQTYTPPQPDAQVPPTMQQTYEPPQPKMQTLDEAVKAIKPGQMGRYTIQKTIRHEEGEDGSNPEDTQSIELKEIEKRRIENTPPAVKRKRQARRARMSDLLSGEKTSLFGGIRSGKNKGNSMSAENRRKRSEAAKAARKDLPAPKASRVHPGLEMEDEDSVMSRENRLRRKEAAQSVREKKEKKVIHSAAFRLNFDDDDEFAGSLDTSERTSKSSRQSQTARTREKSRSSASGRSASQDTDAGRAGRAEREAREAKRSRSAGRTGQTERQQTRQKKSSKASDRAADERKRPSSRNGAGNRRAASAGSGSRAARDPQRRSRQNPPSRRGDSASFDQQVMIMRGAIAAVLLILLIITIVFMIRSAFSQRGDTRSSTQEVQSQAEGAPAESGLSEAEGAAQAEGEAAAVTKEVEEKPVLAKRTEKTEVSNLEKVDIPSFNPHSVAGTEPSRLIEYTEIEVDGEILDSISSYSSADTIDFGYPEDYTDTQGVITFRGNNFRSNPTYGYAEISENKFNKVWKYDTSSLMYGSVYWSGSGWTGQPLLVKWPKELRQKMNMYDWAKNEEELVEVIYACMDGYVYFLDLWTGKETRDTMYIGWTFKGAGALDPRGYPIMYLGAGYDSNEGTARAFIINLLDCSIMHTFGCEDEFSLRGSLSYFDSSALVDAKTDTLIYPGENGIIYLIKLNTNYNEEAGTLSISPQTVKWRYNGVRTSWESYWLGIEDSACIYEGYLFASDNGGNLMCLDLNTLELVWVQDVLDDSNGTPVLSVEDGKVYLYISTSFHLGWRSSDIADIPIWKIDAETGEIVWHTDYDCYSVEDLSGGVLSTIALGAHDLSDYIYVTVSRVGETDDGVLACLNKKDGSIVWEHEAFYAWSSPVCVYNTDGSGKVIYCTCGGMMYMLDGKTGEQYDRAEFGDTVLEASPAVYEDMLVIGSRDCHIYGYELY